jgi:hypothetical protein
MLTESMQIQAIADRLAGLPVQVDAREFDTMLLWEYCADFCDAATLGGARTKFDALDLAQLTRYLAILAVHDDDQAGEAGRKYIIALKAQISRIASISPPAHDLTDFWRTRVDMRTWAARHVARALEEALEGTQVEGPVLDRWKMILEIAKKNV